MTAGAPRALERLGVDQERIVLELLERAVVSTTGDRVGRELRSMVGVLAEEQASCRLPRYRLGAVHVPLLIAHGLVGRPAIGVPVAVVGGAIYVGADALDDLVDGDEPRYWRGQVSPGLVIASASLFAVLGQLLVADVDADATVRAELQAKLSAMLVTLAEGQLLELGASSGRPSSATAREVAAAKSGQVLAAFAEMAALLAGADDEVRGRCHRLGHAIGMVRQVASDLDELTRGHRSADLRTGAPTLPVALHYESLPDAHREDLVWAIAAARTDPRAADELRARLLAGPAGRAAAIEVALWAAEAHALLDELSLERHAAAGLRELIDDASPIRITDQEDTAS
ncbi:MAG: polyprenyl synthetase family protein [Actinomycetota bacterium]